MAGGRPTKYTAEMAALICERVATHPFGLNKLCAMYDDLPAPCSVYLWRLKHPEFSENYAKAKMMQVDILAEECLEIADDDSKDLKIDPETGFETCNSEFIARSRLRIDTRKWLASKLMPKQYGDKSKEEQQVQQSLVERLVDKLIES